MSGPNPPEPEIGTRHGVGDAADHDVPGEPKPYPRAYSAPESEQFSSGPYLPVDPGTYHPDDHGSPAEPDDVAPPRWPWVVGVTTIIAAIALVVAVGLLVARSDTEEPSRPTETTPPSAWNEIPTTTTPPPTPTPTSEEPPPETETSEPPVTETTTVTEAPPPATTTTTSPPAPRQLTYTVSGTKAPLDQITVTYTDASGNRNTQVNVPLPWTITLTPISASDVGSLEATSLLGFSRLNCSIVASDGTVLSRNENNLPRTTC